MFNSVYWKSFNWLEKKFFCIFGTVIFPITFHLGIPWCSPSTLRASTPSTSEYEHVLGLQNPSTSTVKNTEQWASMCSDPSLPVLLDTQFIKTQTRPVPEKMLPLPGPSLILCLSTFFKKRNWKFNLFWKYTIYLKF